MSIRLLALVVFLFVIEHSASADQTISLAWDADSDPSVMGYVVYYGTSSGIYSSRVDIGADTNINITNLQEGMTYYFAITAYDSTYVESAPSPEISYIVPGLLLIQPLANPGDPIVLSFPVAPSHWYEIQVSGNLVGWKTIGTTDVADYNGWMQWSDPYGAALPQRFYRLCMH